MNATLQIRQVLSVSRLARVYTRLARSRANARARRDLSQVDARTLRDIGITRRQFAVLTVTAGAR